MVGSPAAAGSRASSWTCTCGGQPPFSPSSPTRADHLAGRDRLPLAHQPEALPGQVPVEGEERDVAVGAVLEHDDGPVVERLRVVGRRPHDAVQRGVHRGAGRDEQVDAEVHAADVVGVGAPVLRCERRGGVDGAVLAVPADADHALGRPLGLPAGRPVEHAVGQVGQRRAEHRGGGGGRQESPDVARAGYRLVAAGRPEPGQQQLVAVRWEGLQGGHDVVLADQQVVVAGLAGGLPAGHRDAEREPGADEVGQQRELGRRERRDGVVPGDDVRHGARNPRARA